jgi:hypothetical protein
MTAKFTSIGHRSIDEIPNRLEKNPVENIGPCSRFPIVRRTQRPHHSPVATIRPSAPNLFPLLGQEPSSSSPSASSLPIVTGKSEARSSRHVLPENLNAAIRQLDDQELDRLVAAALEERSRRKKPPAPEERQSRGRHEIVPPSLPQGKLNAVKAAFKAGVTPARIAREFGISLSDVRKAIRL